MKKWAGMVAVVVGAAAGGSLIAGELGRLDPQFSALDVNRDGELTVEEALLNKALVAGFVQIDRNDDSRISFREFLAFQSQ